jgi:hypothetical protein
MSAQPAGSSERPPDRCWIPWKARVRRPILVGLIILVAAVIAGSIYVGVAMRSQAASGPPCQALECGPFLVINTPREANASGHWSYNFSVAEAGGGLVLDDLAFQVQGPDGSVIAPAASWTLVVYGLAGMPVGSFEWQTASWSEGGNAVLNSGESIAFGSGTVSLAGVWNNFVVLGQGSVHGSTAVAIP